MALTKRETCMNYVVDISFIIGSDIVSHCNHYAYDMDFL